MKGVLILVNKNPKTGIPIKRLGFRVIPCEKDNFGSDHLKNQLFGPKQVSYTPLGASGPFLTLEGHFSVKIGNFWFLGLSGTQNFK